MLLLIFFLLGSNFVLRSGVSVDMPYSENSLPVVEQSHVIVVSPGRNARIDFNEERITIEELAERLEAQEAGGTRHVILLADKRAEYGTVAEISGLVLKNDFELFFGMNGSRAQ